jgi:hypothetical protein
VCFELDHLHQPQEVEIGGSSQTGKNSSSKLYSMLVGEELKLGDMIFLLSL